MTALALLQPDGLRIYYNDQTPPSGGKFPVTAVTDMEIVNDAEFINVMQTLVPPVPKMQPSTIVVIADALCFSLPVKDGDEEAVKKQLTAATPFAQVAIAKVTMKDQAYLVSTNQDLAEAVVHALGKQQHPVSLVVPWTALVAQGISQGEIDSVTVKRAHDSQEQLKAAAYFLPTEQRDMHVPVVNTEKAATPKGKPKLWLIILVAIAVVYAGVMYWFFIRPQ
jgi:hypothetical protein